MHEYEFRLVVQNTSSFLPFLQSLSLPMQPQTVLYAKPHFRLRDERFETKRVESTHVIYHDGVWFRWVHSVETPFHRWSPYTYFTFLHHIGNFQTPFTVEHRTLIRLDDRAQLYTFRERIGRYKLVFEWEYGTFRKPLASSEGHVPLDVLDPYRALYHRMSEYAAPRYTLHEQMTRRPVTCLKSLPPHDARYLYASKLDGVFGLVYSYGSEVKETWEGYVCVRRPGVTLGDGLVLAAERLPDGQVYLLDVYQVRGHATASWNRRSILTQFLPLLEGEAGYRVQSYVNDASRLNPSPDVPVDGLIAHDTQEDRIYKVKWSHSVDLVYYQGYFWLPNGRIPCLEKGLEEGAVYEISAETGRMVRRRHDRFKGNTQAQIDSVWECGWKGPPIEPLPQPRKTVKKKRAIETCQKI